MIAIDTSAIVAILLKEPAAEECSRVFNAANRIIISASTVTEALIVAMRRSIVTTMTEFLTSSIIEVIPTTEARARRAAEAYARWGKTFHPAALNFGDCFAYATAKEYGCPLLFIGNDFARTDLVSAIPARLEPM